MLKIEVSGPSQANFSILDIPGIFSNDLAVKPKEMEGVRQMAIEYMRQKESIVICVADAGTDLMMQEIFKLANDYVDPARLIGVFTKCDRLNASDASRIAQMTKGEGTGEARAPQSSAVGHNALPHGWFVVRNRTGDDSTAGGPSADLDSIEDELFSQPSWSGVRADRRGTSQLRQYLGNLLSEKIRLAFPKLLAKLDDLLSKSDTELANLGAARTTTHLRRVYLADIARQYELRARDALERPWHVDDSRARVRTLVRAHNDAFGIRMRIDGHAYQFEDHDVSDEEYWSRIEPILKPDISVAVQLPDTPPTSPPRPGRKEKASSRTRLSTAGGQAPIISTSYHTDALLKAISEEVRICGCTELPGFVHPDVIRRLYRMQTERWHDVANDHLRSVATAVQDASCEILSSVVPTVLGKDTLYEGLDQVIRRQYDQALATSLQRLQTYTDGDRSKLLQTTDPAFTRRLRLLQSVRLISTVNRSILKVKMETDNASVEELGAMMFQDAHHSSETNTVLEVHDALKVYYQFSLQAFIHHVTNTIVEDFVTDPDGPLLGFSAKFIYSLPDTDIDRLGGESHETVDQRRRLDDRIRTLREAQQTARVALERARGYGL
ncbi:hypothetical protein SEUCBS139899_009626 [Sporothrix eucalyptigena]|uniref:GED domain-containing protein n=1 Tax=Sporothrix eucalyptigena TaxID=1812306 RepID=A0ABP0C2W0_9PEZI